MLLYNGLLDSSSVKWVKNQGVLRALSRISEEIIFFKTNLFLNLFEIGLYQGHGLRSCMAHNKIKASFYQKLI